MFADDDLLPLSALQHLVYCERRFALVHIERAWVDNPFTVEGTAHHSVIDEGRSESRGALLFLRSVPLVSRRLGISGKSDLVELHAAPDDGDAVAIPGHPGRWRLLPVEYKRGSARDVAAFEVQLCAQALCLEEAFGGRIEAGALFSFRQRKRRPVVFDDDLRGRTESACARIHELFAARETPPPWYASKCKSCSMLEPCQPRAPEHSAAAYLERVRLAAADGKP